MSLPHIIFDVNETLLDLSDLRSAVGAALEGNDDTVSLWFEGLLHYSLVESAANTFSPFGKIGAAVLVQLARQRGIKMTMLEAADVLQPILSASPHPDVIEGLEKLKSKGYRLSVLTNSAKEAMETQLQNAGIYHLFEYRLSVETIEIYKPNLLVYHWASRIMCNHCSDCLFVAAHGWDVAGAREAGMRTAFIDRPGQSKYLLNPDTDYSVATITELAKIL